MGLTIHLCIAQCCFQMKVSEHLTCINNHLNSYLVAYLQRVPRAGRREKHKLDSGKPEGGIEDTPRHGADQGGTPSGTGILWGGQTLPGAQDLPGDTFTLPNSCLNCLPCPSQDSIWGCQARYLPFPHTHLPSLCMGNPQGYCIAHTWMPLLLD